MNNKYRGGRTTSLFNQEARKHMEESKTYFFEIYRNSEANARQFLRKAKNVYCYYLIIYEKRVHIL